MCEKYTLTSGTNLEETSNGENHALEKICTRCRLPKPIETFHRFGKNTTRVGKWCEDCFQKHGAGGTMNTQNPKVTELVEAPPTLPSVALQDAAADAEALATASRAPSTWRAYESDWRIRKPIKAEKSAALLRTFTMSGILSREPGISDATLADGVAGVGAPLTGRV